MHRTSQFVFQEDNYAINAARIKINEEFKKNKEAEDSVKQLKLANDVINELKTNIVQAKKVEESGAYSKLYFMVDLIFIINLLCILQECELQRIPRNWIMLCTMMTLS